MSLQVFVFESDPGRAALFESIIREVAPTAFLFPATTLYEAQRIVGIARPDVCVLDLGEGKEVVELLADFKTYHPLARMLLVVPEVLPEGFDLAQRSGAVHFLPKTFTPAQARKMLAWLLNPGSVPADSFYQAHLHHVNLLDVLQMKIQGGFTTLLEITSSSGLRGRIILDQGKIAHAVMGSLQGKPAFEDMIQWKGGAITEQPAPTPVLHSIDQDSQILLIEAARMLDRKMQAESHAEPIRGNIPESTGRVVMLDQMDEAELRRFKAMPKILVVDDNPMILQCAEEMLAHAWPSHAIIGVETGTQGLECAGLYLPQVILLDYILPDIRGDEFATRMREQEILSSLPIILMSGFVEDIKAAAPLHPNIIGTLAKPFMMQELIRMVKQAMEAPVRVATIAAGPTEDPELTYNVATRVIRQQKPPGAGSLLRGTVRIVQPRS